MRCAVVIGTYNEAENIPSLLPEILRLGDDYGVIIVDDNSPDGTGKLVEAMKADHSRIHVVHRERRLGYGTAYSEGFRVALAMGADYIVQMDADYSHNPRDIPRLVEVAGQADIAIGSRYAEGGRTEGWPLHRRIISRTASRFARYLLGVPLADFTGGFKFFPSRRYYFLKSSANARALSRSPVACFVSPSQSRVRPGTKTRSRRNVPTSGWPL